MRRSSNYHSEDRLKDAKQTERHQAPTLIDCRASTSKETRMRVPCLSTIAVLLLQSWLTSGVAFAQEKILLWPNGAPGAKGNEDKDQPSLTVYLPAPEKASGTAVVICPGGGYGHLAVGHEGEEIGKWLNSIGIAGFVLRYRLAPTYQHPCPMWDVQRGLRTVRARAAEWKIDPSKVGVLGFSAGGHLASTAATHFDDGDAASSDPIDRVSCRPDFAVLCYPVISFTDESVTHRGSRENLLGKNPANELVELLSNEKQVTAKTPPVFLWHTSEDKGVPPGNSVLFYLACIKSGVPSELHIYEKGPHGIGLAKSHPSASFWPQECEAWLKGRGLLKK
jgi:acetyl esterase/lipase